MLAACTGAPELDVSPPHLQAGTPRVRTPRGELSEARSDALLERQDKKREPTLLDRHLANMQRVSGTRRSSRATPRGS